jgi:hypothetical protein
MIQTNFLEKKNRFFSKGKYYDDQRHFSLPPERFYVAGLGTYVASLGTVVPSLATTVHSTVDTKNIGG